MVFWFLEVLFALFIVVVLSLISKQKAQPKSNYLFWTKVQLALDLHVKAALLYLLHNRGNDPFYNGLPEDPRLLYSYLQNWWKNLPLNDQKHLDRKVLKQTHKDQLFPPNGQQVDSSTWDVTLIVVILRNCIPVLKPFNGWANPPAGDQSKGANITRARDLRNKLKHGNLNDIETQQRFDDLWIEITKILNGLGYTNMKKFQELKTDSSLDIYVEAANKILEGHLNALQQKYLDEYDGKTKASIKLEMDKVKQSLQIFKSRLQDLEDRMKLNDIEIKNLHQNILILQDEQNILYDDLNLIEQSNIQINDSIQIHEDNIDQNTAAIIENKETIDHNTAAIKSLEQQTSVTDLDPMKFLIKDALSILDHNLTTDEKEDLKKAFHLKDDAFKWRIEWKTFQSELRFMRRNDLIKEIQMKTDITVGMQQRLSEFRKTQQKNCVGTLTLPFPDTHAHGRTKAYGNENTLFVKLLLRQLDTNLETDRLEFIKMDMSMEELISEDSSLTVVSGMAGIGKSTLVKQLMNAWLKGKIWKGLLVIPIKCCDLNNQIITEETSILDLIRKLHPDLGKLTSMDFQEIAKRTVLLVDGIDEFIGIKSIASKEIEPCGKILMDLLNDIKVFCKWRVLLGRPHASRLVQNVIIGHSKQTFISIELCGFDEQIARIHVRNLFNNKPEMAEMLERKLQSSKTLAEMLNMPAYMWSICGVHQQLPLKDVPKTFTELHLYNILLFQQKHWLSKEHSLMSLDDVVNNPKTLKYTKLIAKFAYQTLYEQKKAMKINFENEVLDEFQKMGLVINGDNHVEFPHLAIQELFAAIYTMLEASMEERGKMLGNSALTSCLHFVAGLEGLFWSEKNTLPHTFAKMLFKDVELNTQTPFIALMEDKLLAFLTRPTLIQPSEMEFHKCLQYFYEFQMIKPTLFSKLMILATQISINYIGSTNLYLIDHLVDSFICYGIPFSINHLTINSDLLKYGTLPFIRQLILDHSQKIKELSIEVTDMNISQINYLVHVFCGRPFDLNTITVRDRSSGYGMDKVFDCIILAVSSTKELRFENSNVNEHLFYELSKLQTVMESLVIDRCVLDFHQIDRWRLPESLKSLRITKSLLSDDFACFLTKKLFNLKAEQELCENSATKYIKELSFAECKISWRLLYKIIEILSMLRKCKVESIDLNGNDFEEATDQDKLIIDQHVHQLLSSDQLIVEEMNLSNSKMIDDVLLSIIGCFKFVKKINLSLNNLTYMSLVNILQFLSTNTCTLKSIDLSGNFKITSDEDRIVMENHLKDIPVDRAFIEEIKLEGCGMDKDSFTPTIIHLLRLAEYIRFNHDDIVTGTFKDGEFSSREASLNTNSDETVPHVKVDNNNIDHNYGDDDYDHDYGGGYYDDYDHDYDDCDDCDRDYGVGDYDDYDHDYDDCDRDYGVGDYDDCVRDYGVGDYGDYDDYNNDYNDYDP